MFVHLRYPYRSPVFSVMAGREHQRIRRLEPSLRDNLIRIDIQIFATWINPILWLRTWTAQMSGTSCAWRTDLVDTFIWCSGIMTRKKNSGRGQWSKALVLTDCCLRTFAHVSAVVMDSCANLCSFSQLSCALDCDYGRKCCKCVYPAHKIPAACHRRELSSVDVGNTSDHVG